MANSIGLAKGLRSRWPFTPDPNPIEGWRDLLELGYPILPRFYFQLIEDGVVVADQKGLELEQLEIAELDSAIAIAEMMVNRVARLGPQTITVVISDEKRHPVARVTLTLTKERLS